ncbi:hypothetical protein ACFVT6_02625 [Streptomyces sp. NPDC058049]|uniref:hypothetical protein n=1 Tax=Streptomyces sp. NPDC058049 TaxID=3346314 RepID=UPI0036F0BB6B
MELPQPYRDFLMNMGGSGASPYYGRWLDHMTAGLDNRALGVTSPRLHAHPHGYRMASKV